MVCLLSLCGRVRGTSSHESAEYMGDTSSNANDRTRSMSACVGNLDILDRLLRAIQQRLHVLVITGFLPAWLDSHTRLR